MTAAIDDNGMGALGAAGRRYNGVAMALHWVTALFVILILGTALAMTPLSEGGRTSDTLVMLHASLGFSVLILTLARIVWRLTNRPPKLPGGMPAAERWGARIAHVLFYLLLVIIPMGGWVVASVTPDQPPVQWFGVAELPRLPPPPPEQQALVAERVASLHGTLGYVMLGLVVLHVAAALRHALILRDGVFARMWPMR